MSAKHNLHGDVIVDGGSGVARIDLKTTANFGRYFNLEANGNDAIIDAQDSLKLRSDGGDTEIHLYPAGQDYISFATASTEQMRINQPGNVLIGTTTDAGYKLDVNGTLRTVNDAYFATTSGNVGIGTSSPSQKLHVDGTVYAVNGFKVSNGYSIGAIGSNSALRFNNDNILFNNSSGNEAVRFVASTGNVLIGTNTDAGYK
jgi:hypothetical protein